MELHEKMVKSETVYRGKILNLRVDQVELPNGKKAVREVVEHAGAVAVVPINEKREIIMVKQYRYPAGRVLLEVPAGKIEKGEDPALCAERELLEETGYRAGDMVLLYSFYTTPGFSDERMYLYLARGLTRMESSPDEDEFIRLHCVPMDAALEMVSRGEIMDAKSIIGILASVGCRDSKAGLNGPE